MKHIAIMAGALALGASAAAAGGIERSPQSVAILFEEGNYLEFNLGRARPEVSGNQQFPAPGGPSSGDMAGDFTSVGLGLKIRLNDRLDLGLVLDEPVGADVSYPLTAYPYAGSTAEINSHAVTAYLRYRLPSDISLIGGVRAIRTAGEVALFNGYTMNTSTETDFGYVLGVAWEKPEIAARVALTYNSAVTHDFASTELGLATAFATTIPQSVNLEFQTGVAADTLVFGSIRWVDWTEFDISPPVYMDPGQNPFGDPLVEYHADTTTYTLGVGRRFSDTWSGAAFISHEDGAGGYSGNLGPTDGSTALGLAATYTRGQMKITGGLRYVLIGDAKTEVPALFGIPAGTCDLAGDEDCGTFSSFRDNRALAAGLRVGFNF